MATKQVSDFPQITSIDGDDFIHIKTLGGVDNKIKVKDLILDEKLPRHFDTVALAKAEDDLQVGDYVRTGGYTSFGDGGGALYRVVAGGIGTDDGGSYHDMSNGNQLELIVSDHIDLHHFGAAGDGITVDSTAIYNAWQFALTKVLPLQFRQGKTYLIDDSEGTVPDTDFGKVLCFAEDRTTPTLIGNGCTIKLVNHDVSTGGMMFAGGRGCDRPIVRGFNFDMTFTGVNTSSSLYPHCGAVKFVDDATGVQPQSELNRDVLVKDCTFKLFHPYGQYAQSGAPYSGDGNNGFKVFSVFIKGDNAATSFANQNRNATIQNCTLKEGHNGYGFWIWAYNNAVFDNPTAEDYVGKYSTSAGAFAGGGVPFIRYHQFDCKGVKVINPQFRAKPCSERTTANFEGTGDAIGFNTNDSAAGKDGGLMEIIGGNIIGGNGDSANSAQDKLIFCSAYGVLRINGATIDGINDTTNAIAGEAISYSSESTGGTGYGELHIDASFGKNCDYYNNVVFLNGVDSAAADRRCKILNVKITSYGQRQYAIDMNGGSSKTYQGAQLVSVHDTIVDGYDNSGFDETSTNSRAFRLSSSSGDTVKFNGVTVSGKYYEFITSNMNATTNFTVDEYTSIGTTTRFIGSVIPVMGLTGSGTPESNEAANIGSTFRRTDGGASTSFYVKESGTGTTGWVAK